MYIDIHMPIQIHFLQTFFFLLLKFLEIMVVRFVNIEQRRLRKAAKAKLLAELSHILYFRSVVR